MHASRDGIAEDLLGEIAASRCQRADAAAQAAGLLDGDKAARTPVLQVLRKVLRQGHHDVAAHKCLETLARKTHISVLVLAYRCDVFFLLLDELAADVARIITAFRREVCDAVADAKRAFMREQFPPDRLPVQGPRHDPE